MFLKRRVFQLDSKVNDIAEESELTIKLLDVLNKQSARLMSTIANASSPEAFSDYYRHINSTLFKYKELLTRINCDLEMTVLAEVTKWEVENNLSCNPAICGNAEKDKIVRENSCLHMENKLPDNSEKLENNSYNFLKNVSELKFHFNKDITAHSGFQSLNNSETIGRYTEETLNLITKDKYDKIKERIFSNFSSAILDSQKRSDNNIENFRIENCKSENIKSKKTNCDISKLTAINFDRILNSKNKIKTLKISKLPDAEHPCIIGNIVSPTEFYMYFTTSESFLLLQCDKELKLLTQEFKLSKNLTNLKDYLCLLKKKEILKQSGFFALFYSEIDDTFHRVKIKNEIFDEVSKVNIILIDYGLTINNVCLEKLYLMPDHFHRYPAFAIRCHLAEETLPDLNSSNLNSELLNVFNNWATKNQKVIVVIDKNECDKVRDSLPVKIYNSDKNECLNLALKDYLEKNKMSKMKRRTESSPTDNVKNDALEKWNPMKEDFNSNMNSYDIDIEDPAIAIYGYVGKDYERICSLYESRGECFKGASCKKEHIKMNPDGYTTDKEEIYKKAFKVLKIPYPDDVLYVTVTHIVNGTEFYCVADKLQNDYEEETLSSLVHYMNIEYNVSKMKRLTVPPSIGQVVIGKFKGDNSWYRAKVVDVAPEKDEYNLYFVDYGNSETVSYSDIRAIEVQYLHLPFQAIHCMLHGVKNSCQFSEESKNYIQNVIAQTVKIKVMSVFPGDNYELVVKAYDKNGDEIADNLIKKKIILSVDGDDDMTFPVSANALPG